jgi:hypothetical protein
LGLPSQYGVDEVHESYRDLNSGPGALDLAIVNVSKKLVLITAMLKSGAFFPINSGAGLGGRTIKSAPSSLAPSPNPCRFRTRTFAS